MKFVMSVAMTRYIIVPNFNDAQEVEKLLDDGYTLVISWVAGDSVHHILSKEKDV